MKTSSSKDLRHLTLVVILVFVTGLFSVSARAPQTPAQGVSEAPESCTSIQVGRLASADGSVMTCHTCDGNYRTWLNIVPHQKHPQGSTNKIYWGTLHTETPQDTRGKIQKGEIPQVEETYAYLNTAYPCLNEKQLAIGETTIGGKRELENDEGLFLIEELERIALERCSTARDAIRLIGQLVKQYGYGDSGECITIADKREVWHFEIFGAGPAQIGAVWAAVRIPDDQVGVSANRPRISTLDLKDADHYMASENVYSVAQEMGFWDPKKGEPFKFWKAYSSMKPFSDREYYIFNKLAPSLHLSMDAEELPFTIKPEKKLSVRDVMRMYRETYEGTDFDMTRNLLVPKPRPRGEQAAKADESKQETITSPLANNWMSRELITLLNTLKPGTVETRRTIAISACAYSQIIQVRDWLPDEIGGVAWFSFDNPAQSPRFPIFAGTLSLPKSFENCAQQRFRTDSAAWAFRQANRLATVRWGATRKYIEDGIMEFEDRAFLELPDIEKRFIQLRQSEDSDASTKCREYLTQYTNDFARAAMGKWTELAETFWAMFARGF
jgi:dipeptidase